MSKLRGLEKNDEDVRYSKTLAYLLRHGAEKQGLPMRKDGYVRVVDILDEPNLRALTFPHLYHLVESNAKKRFVLFYGYDPSASRPERKKKQQGQTKKALKLQQDRVQEDVQKSGLPTVVGNAACQQESPLVPLDAPQVEKYDPEHPASGNQQKPDERSPTLGSNAKEPEWFIRAAQGHSITTVTTEHLEPITSADEEGLSKVGEMVHGSKAELWESIRETGLSRGSRQHIHLARARSGATSGPRANSSLYIYLSLPRLLTQDPPIAVFMSTNNVILTPGNAQGVISKELFSKVVRLRRDISRPVIMNEAQGQPAAKNISSQESDIQQEIQPAKRDRKNRERPRFIEEVIWENGAAVDPPRSVEPDETR
ncbi:hypothetical protein NliqN6_1027 [Naganishia liquefaciens]|uniref:2'-phosphotransferase n=1 Tax=Naganishia liquefaciens TaxID=104408 RepID=A0A8H3YCR8_9TREE|nr:hypothetical protein NliqN6_1027 [Naganishia liquefaciens]